MFGGKDAGRAVIGIALGFAFLVLSSSIAAAQATYSYTGNPFTFFSCGPNGADTATMACSGEPAPGNTLTSYKATDHVTATLTLASPLGPNFAFADVRGLPGFALTLNDSEHAVATPLTAGEGMFASVSTDASGNINQWRLAINTGGVENGGVVTFDFSDVNGSHVFDQGVLACCDPVVSGNLAENFGLPGTWGGASPATGVTNLTNMVSNPSLGLTAGQISSLTDKLNNALASIEAGQNKQAINQLNAFINSVQSSVNTRKISAETGATLIAAAQAIIAAL